MPRIKDATGLTLSTIVTELRLDYLRDKREVRSRSSDLYLKEEGGKYASSISRKLHREKAIGLVRDSLAAEHNITTDQAQQILTNLFGQAPNGITSSDLVRLRDLGETAQILHKGLNRDVPQAFDLARGLNEKSRFFRKMLKPVSTLVTAEKDKDQDHDEALMLQWPPFESSPPEIKEHWLACATKLAKSSNWLSNLQRLLPEQKLSLQMAVTEHLHSIPEHSDTIDERSDAALINGRICCGYTLYDLMNSDDEKMLNAFMKEVADSEIIFTSSGTWETQNTTQREEVIQTIIDAHAKAFGYADSKPSLELCEMFEKEPDTIGGFDEGSNKLILATSKNRFNDFVDTFGTVSHELTHAYQHALVTRMEQDQIAPNDPLYTRARIFAHNAKEGNYFNRDTYVNRFNIESDIAMTLYKANPTEQVAFYVHAYVNLLQGYKSSSGEESNSSATTEDDTSGDE